MYLSAKQLKKVTVVTKSGQVLGKVVDFELDTETGLLARYHVKSNELITGLFENKLIIHKDQVISLDEQEMIVEDSLLKALAKNEPATKLGKIEGAEPAITSKNS